MHVTCGLKDAFVFVEGGHLDGQIGGVQLLHSNHGASDVLVGLFFWSASLMGGKWFSKQKGCQFVCWKKVKDVEMFSSTGKIVADFPSYSW